MSLRLSAIALCWSCVLSCVLSCVAGPLAAATYHVSPAGSDVADRDGLTLATAWKTLAFACNRITAGAHSIQLAPGTHVASVTAQPKSGLTIVGAGRDGANATVVIADHQWKLAGTLTGMGDPGEYLISMPKQQGVSIRDLVLSSPAAHQITGAIAINEGGGHRLERIGFRFFRWNAVHIHLAGQLLIADCSFHECSRDALEHCGGYLRTRWLSHSEIHGCVFTGTTSKGYGYKGSGHERVRFHHNRVEVDAEFSFESAHDNEYGLEIDRNHLTRCISVPKSGQGADPQTRACDYSVHIHHNLLTDSYTVEGPRNHLRIDHNWIRIAKPGGRVYTQHGGDNDGPVLIDHNVIENVDRAVVWKNRGRALGIRLLNNTIICAPDAQDRAGPLVDAFRGEDIDGWEVKNNLIIAHASQPRRLAHAQATSGPKIAYSNNRMANIVDAPAGQTITSAPGFAAMGDKPWPYYAPLMNGPLVDAGADVGLPFSGKAPDIGVYEVDEAKPPFDVPLPSAQ